MASAPYIPLPSPDRGDTRPDTSGNFPSFHYNIPLYGPQGGSAGLDPFGHYVAGPIAKTIATTLQQNFNPLTSQGIANIAGIMVPGGMKGEPTLGQQQFLNSIYNSSRGESGGIYPSGDRSITQLGNKLGTPHVLYSPPAARGERPGYETQDPVLHILNQRDIGGSGLDAGAGLSRNQAWSHFVTYLDKLPGTDYSVNHPSATVTAVTSHQTGSTGLYDTVTGEFLPHSTDLGGRPFHSIDVLGGFNPSGLNTAGITAGRSARDLMIAYLKSIQTEGMKPGTENN